MKILYVLTFAGNPAMKATTTATTKNGLSTLPRVGDTFAFPEGERASAPVPTGLVTEVIRQIDNDEDASVVISMPPLSRDQVEGLKVGYDFTFSEG